MVYSPNVFHKQHILEAFAAGKHVFVEFEGARQAAEVYLNGKYVGLNENGVMAFGFDLTPYLQKGKNDTFVLMKE